MREVHVFSETTAAFVKTFDRLRANGYVYYSG